jgi:LDH2 family malate/lactate/ureidoglycolate dehydrogenase
MSMDDRPPVPRYRAADLIAFARALFGAAGCDGDKPQVIAELLVEADLMGHTTHGLQLCAPYLGEIESGAMKPKGEPAIVADRGPAVTWDGGTLPGVWLTARAIDLAVERAKKHGLCAVAIRRSHHIACLAAFLTRATAHGMMVTIASSDPADASVAPFGGLSAVFTPDPIAVGIPTDGDPILIDMSASITTNGMTNRLRKEGKRYPGKWAMTNKGEATDDPNTLFTDPPGTILPTGGKDHGHKGYGLALTVESLTQALPGHGRSDKPPGWGAGVFVQVFDPAAFGGSTAFIRETGWIAAACRDNPPAPGVTAVRLPGQQALAKKRAALKDGVALYPGIMDALKPWAGKLSVALPKSMA